MINQKYYPYIIPVIFLFVFMTQKLQKATSAIFLFCIPIL